jgi:hypothetical protein
MSQGTETFIRTLGGIIAAAIISAALGFFATASNLTVLGSYAPIIATVAASLLADGIRRTRRTVLLHLLLLEKHGCHSEMRRVHENGRDLQRPRFGGVFCRERSR